ncbi:unnamed protein product [Blepharisma stoltei]|uniref:Uncharacterized protein n=1 Tax=Blepharisma stoltei TaxID=1481888 RepID=A0AAU9K2B5_9CILI|nr:unnamed protein product [Blepharisma stoltei]
MVTIHPLHTAFKSTLANIMKASRCSINVLNFQENLQIITDLDSVCMDPHLIAFSSSSILNIGGSCNLYSLNDNSKHHLSVLTKSNLEPFISSTITGQVIFKHDLAYSFLYLIQVSDVNLGKEGKPLLLK